MSGREYDVAVIGGGVVGSSVAFGLAQRGLRVAVFDEGDLAQRASRTNFGLVWVQTKGDGMPAYMRWTRRSADLWPRFAAELERLTGIDVEYRKVGGLVYCIGARDFDDRARAVAKLRAQADIYDTEMLDRVAVERLMPEATFGAAVTGASYCPHDGHCNPLLLLKALHAALQRQGVEVHAGAAVRTIDPGGSRFAIESAGGRCEAAKVVLAAGHGVSSLAGQVGLRVPLKPERGQILVTERYRPFLPIPGSGVRQTGDGTILIGSSKEKTGFDDGTTVAEGARMAARAIAILPELAKARLNRTWGGIRVLTPDNHPIYVESERCPGAFVTVCHSGVTLAAAHAEELAEAIATGRLAEKFDSFHPRRFDVQEAA